jgi:hypothetical protein
MTTPYPRNTPGSADEDNTAAHRQNQEEIKHL